MKPARVETAARLTLAAWAALTSLYAALCFIPFVFKNFIEARILPAWVGTFIAGHAFLTTAVFFGAGAALPGRRAWNAASTIVAAVFFLYPLKALSPGLGAALVMTLSVLPLIAWEGLIARARAAAVDWSGALTCEGSLPRLAGAAAAGALCAAASLSATRAFSWTSRQACLAASASALQHAFLFAAAAAALEAARRGAQAARRPRAALAAGETVLAFLLLRACVGGLILAPLDMRGVAAQAAAWLWAAAAASVWAGHSLARAGSEEFLLPSLGSCAPGWARAAAVLLAAAAPQFLAPALKGNDWNGMIFMIGVLGTWLAAFAALRPAAGRGAEKPAVVLAGTLLAAAWLGATAVSAADPLLRLRAASPSELMTQASGLDPSLRLIRRATQWSAKAGFFEVLRRNTNISREEDVAPRTIELVDKSWAPGTERPDIYIFIIDSLRRDYVGAYNPAATFTPSIDAFARESVAWKNTFTAYGATGLSEPSIWAGSMLIHKLYVTPFAAMNSLEKLLDRLEYKKILTVDAVVDALWRKDTGLTDLEAAGSGDFALCKSLKQAELRLDQAPKGRPLFFYSQPQDIHVATINREKRTNVTGKAYPGFDAAYASRLETIDACFGRFTASLKKRGRFDDSLIILAADHGDSLGEEGRWGHAYTIFPEILRVPIIMHLPKTFEGRAKIDRDGPAFLIDLTPTLYQLLGRGAPRLDLLLGRPLLSMDGADPAAWRKPEQMVVSSYGPAYGIMREGKKLFIGDGVNFRYYQYDLEGDPIGRKTALSSSAKSDGERSVLTWVERLNAFWRRKT